jgi:AAA domain
VIVINLWGGPGCGKSTTAAGLFSLMKMRGHKVELVTEYAKELTYSGEWTKLTQQEHILFEQWQRQARLENNVDYAITDSPLPLNIIYAREDLRTNEDFSDKVMDYYNEFDNFNIMLKRCKPYSFYGRKETSDKALEIDHECIHMLEALDTDYHWVRGDEDSPVIIYNMLFGNYRISMSMT